MHLSTGWKLEAGQASEAGIKPQNEDCMGIRIPDEPQLTTKGAIALIADGVSSAEGGKMASQCSVLGFLSDYYSTPESWQVKTSAHRVLTALNRWLWGQSHRFDDSRNGYVTTLSILILKSRTAHIFHIGDSRVYRYRNGLEQLTTDHATWVDRKTCYLTRAMGLEPWPEVDYLTTDVQQGDVFFLTTDGIHDFVQKGFLEELIRDAGDPDTACQQALAHALEQGSHDNVSCQMLRVLEVGSEDQEGAQRRLTALPFPPELEPGMLLDGYRILKQLHASNRSQVYLVEDSDTGEKRVMKTPSVNFEDDPAFIERFVMEEWVGRRIESPYVVGVVEPAKKRSCLYYLTEYVAGISLEEWIHQNPSPDIREVVRIIEHIARGLLKFHRRETIHQDMKPGNVVLDPDGVPRIIDFGSCHVAGIAEIHSPIDRDVVLGTRSYAAPEQVWGQGADPRADLFALAAICYEMLTGKLPYADGLEKVETPQDLADLVWVPAPDLNPLVPVWMDGALRRALAPDRDQRYPAFSEFLYDLKTPNEALSDPDWKPLYERNPLLVWKSLVATLLVTQIVSLWFLIT